MIAGFLRSPLKFEAGQEHEASALTRKGAQYLGYVDHYRVVRCKRCGGRATVDRTQRKVAITQAPDPCACAADEFEVGEEIIR